MSVLNIRLFGRFRLDCGEHSCDTLGSSKADELCAFLALRKRPCSRDIVGSALWEGRTRKQARTYLRRAVWQLQVGFRERLGIEASASLDLQPERLAQAVEGGISTDAEALAGAFALVLDKSGDAMEPAEAAEVESAVASYGGDLLESREASWLLALREQFRLQHLMLLEKTVTFHLVHERPERALDCAVRLVGCDLVRERSHRLLMRVFLKMGDRAAALRQYDLCAEQLKSGYGIAPSRETTSLRQRICEGVPPAACDVARPLAAGGGGAVRAARA